MTNKFYVVAGTYDQYRAYLSKNEFSSHYVYVSHPDMLRGLKDPHGVFVGSWIDRHDIEDIILNLRIATSTQTTFNVGVDKAYAMLVTKGTTI